MTAVAKSHPEQFDPALLDRIPPLPGVVMDLMRSFDDPNVGTAAIAEKISHEPGISLRVLRIVNSPFYGLPRQIGSLPEAVMVLGFATVRSLVVGASVVAQLPGARDGAFDPHAVWRHSFKCALLARRLARHAQMDPEWAFTAALFHDAGKLVMYCGTPGLFARVQRLREEQSVPALDAERELYGVHHGEVGARLMARWKLPERIETAVAHHHTPEADGDNPLCELVHLADTLAHTAIPDCMPSDALSAAARRPFRWLKLSEAALPIDPESFRNELASLSGLLGEGPG